MENTIETQFILSDDKKILQKYRGSVDGETVVSVPNTVVVIEKEAFSACQNIKEIILPEGVEIIGEYAFYRCADLQKVTLPSSVRTIGRYAFSESTALAEVEFVDGLQNETQLTVIYENTFSGCIGLEKVNLPHTVASLENHAFSECKQLEHIALPMHLQSIQSGVFYQANRLKHLQFPETIAEIHHTAFFGCSAVELLDLSHCKSLQMIGANAFGHCTSLCAVMLPDGLSHIGELAFARCTRLSHCNIPSRIKEMGDDLFIDCHQLQTDELSLPNTVEKIGLATLDVLTHKEDVVIPKHVKELFIGVNNKVLHWGMYDCTKLIFQPFATVSNTSFTVKSAGENEVELLSLSFTSDQQYRAVSKVLTGDWASNTKEILTDVCDIFLRIENIENQYAIAKAYCQYTNFLKMENRSFALPVFSAFISENLLDIFEFYMNKYDVSIVNILAKSGFINDETIDDCIDCADDNDESEFMSYLLNLVF